MCLEMVLATMDERPMHLVMNATARVKLHLYVVSAKTPHRGLHVSPVWRRVEVQGEVEERLHRFIYGRSRELNPLEVYLV